MGKGLIGFVMVVMLAGCGDTPRQINLQLLAAEQSTLDGQLVVTEGLVQSFADPLHYWLEDDALNRVALEPDALVADYVGERVSVEGRFHADRERGRRIEVHTVRPLADD